MTTSCYCHVCGATHEKNGAVSSPAAQTVNGLVLPVAACDHHTQAEIRAAYRERTA